MSKATARLATALAQGPTNQASQNALFKEQLKALASMWCAKIAGPAAPTTLTLKLYEQATLTAGSSCQLAASHPCCV